MAALRRLWQEARSARFALLAFVAALLTSAGWLGYFVRTEEEGSSRRWSWWRSRC